jgi:uncharacterized metal-binding protein YceD (DUF177 family)
MVSVTPSGWSVSVRLDEVPESGLRFGLAADAGVRTTVARVADVEAVSRLEAEFEVTRYGRNGLRVSGTISATVRQTCVVTLEPLENEIREPVDLTFVPGNAASTPAREENLGAHEPPERLIDGGVDLGAIAAEFFILGIDPYPRREGAVFTAPASEDAADHPFAALAQLKKRG